jgi:hypothetical protein
VLPALLARAATNAAGTDWATLFTAVTAGAAAVAAIAALATVYVEHRARARAREPSLSIGVAHVFGRCERITVENEGGGVARDVNFFVISDPHFYGGALPPTSTLAPGKRIVIDSVDPPSSVEVFAVVTCRWGPYLMAWNLGGRHERHRIRRWSPAAHQDLVAAVGGPSPETIKSFSKVSGYQHRPDLSSH